MGVIRKQSIQSTLIQYFGAFIGFANRIFIFTFFLSVEEVGLTNILLTNSLLLGQIAAVGFESMTLRFFPYFNDRKRGHHNFLFWLFVIPTVAYAILLILIAIFQEPIFNYFKEESPMMVEYFWYLGILGLAQLYFALFDAYLRSLHKTVVTVLFREVIQKLVIAFAVILYGLGWLNFPQFVLAYVALISSMTILALVYTMWLNQFHFKPKITWRLRQLSRKLMVYGGYVLLANVSAAMIYNIDSLMLASYEGMGSVGVYTTAFYASALLMIPWRALSKISSPKVAELWKQGNMLEMDKLYKRTSLINIAIGVTLFGLMLISLDSLFSYLPKDYADGYGVILIIGGSRVFDLITGLNGYILLTSKYYRLDLYLNIFLLILAVGLNMLLIPMLKIEGAAWATAIAVTIANLVRLIVVWKKFGLHPFTNKMLLVGLLGTIAFCFQYFVQFEANVILLGIIRAIVFGIPLLFGFLYLKVITPQMLRGKFS